MSKQESALARFEAALERYVDAEMRVLEAAVKMAAYVRRPPHA